MQKTKIVIRLFTLLMRRTIHTQFNLPAGALSEKIITGWLTDFEKKYGEASIERLTDYCVAQVYYIYTVGDRYLSRWRVSHSFGGKAMQRFACPDCARYRREDRWLEERNLSRAKLVAFVRDLDKHPLERFIHPGYEEATKRRKLSTEVGFYICCSSTTLWTPFSKACGECAFAERCAERLKRMQPELYRLRSEKFKAGERGTWE